MADNKSVFQYDDNLQDKKISTQEPPDPINSVDVDNNLTNDIAELGEAGKIDISEINKFTAITRDRESVYDMIDTMAEDVTIAAALEIYAEDATETNSEGKSIWCESSDSDVFNYINYLMNSMEINKYIYKWVYNLVKYGDCYLRLYHESEFDSDMSGKQENKPLNEAVIFKAYDKKDKLVHFLEMQPNPAEMYELTRFGKTYAYVKAPISLNLVRNNDALNTSFNRFQYKFRRNDVYISGPLEYVHACLDNCSIRATEEIFIYNTDKDNNLEEESLFSYKVRRGQSALYDCYKSWRQRDLMKNAILLNRLTRSSITRLVNVNVGSMGKEEIGKYLLRVKQLIEQKASLKIGDSMNEYTNPGATENTVYLPVRENNQGSVSISELGGDVNVKDLEDLKIFDNDLYAGIKIPKQYLGDTDDSTGFNGGTSLSLVSSRYAKTIKRIQAAMCQAITDAINILLIDKGKQNYINRFIIKMQEPTTQEQQSRRDSISSELGLVSDIMNLITSNEDINSLEILKALLSNTISNTTAMNLLQERIDKLKEEQSQNDDQMSESMNDYDQLGLDNSFSGGSDSTYSDSSSNQSFDYSNDDFLSNNYSEDTSDGNDQFNDLNSAMPTEPSTPNSLPSPADLSAGDFTDMET